MTVHNSVANAPSAMASAGCAYRAEFPVVVRHGRAVLPSRDLGFA
jgi:hypothetical protein